MWKKKESRRNARGKEAKEGEKKRGKKSANARSCRVSFGRFSLSSSTAFPPSLFFFFFFSYTLGLPLLSGGLAAHAVENNKAPMGKYWGYWRSSSAQCRRTCGPSVGNKYWVYSTPGATSFLCAWLSLFFFSHVASVSNGSMMSSRPSRHDVPAAEEQGDRPHFFFRRTTRSKSPVENGGGGRARMNKRLTVTFFFLGALGIIAVFYRLLVPFGSHSVRRPHNPFSFRCRPYTFFSSKNALIKS